MKYLIRIILGLFVILLTNSCKKGEEENEIIRPVKYEVVGEMNALTTRTFSGVAAASDDIDLSFRNNGTVIKRPIKTGQRVKKGELLIQLDNVQARLEYEKSVSALQNANSALNTAKLSLERTKALYEKGSRSLSEYEHAKNDFQSALDFYEAAKRKKELDQTVISYGYIYAPKSGTIAKVDISMNETVNSGQIVAVLNAGDAVNVRVGVPENVINNISLGMAAEIEFTSISPGQKFSASVIEIAPIVDNNSATYPVKLDLEKQLPDLRPGMVASVTFTFGSIEESDSKAPLVVPIMAVGEDGNGNFVFVIVTEDNEIGIVNKKTIVIGDITSSGFEVKSGLEKGELIATAGLHSMLNGQKVRLK